MVWLGNGRNSSRDNRRWIGVYQKSSEKRRALRCGAPGRVYTPRKCEVQMSCRDLYDCNSTRFPWPKWLSQKLISDFKQVFHTCALRPTPRTNLILTCSHRQRPEGLETSFREFSRNLMGQ
ncbi:hypothetical protein OSTOST_22608 [Ostertagia ostertagi]